MERKIIELTKMEHNDFQCIICCKEMATTKVKINRTVREETLNAFHVCDKCVAKMQKDIETYK